MIYRVEIDHFDPTTRVSGCGCKWCDSPEAIVKNVDPIDDCVLTPGDPSPVGRCPECGLLVYVEKAADVLHDAAPALLKALKSAYTIIAGLLTEEQLSATMRDGKTVRAHSGEIRAAIAQAKRNKP
jgi:hypothetical protein